MYLKHYISLLLTSVLFFHQLEAQELPPINVFTPQQYNGESQNWAISQAQDKTIYVANNVGLLEYNGAKWTRYNSPNETILRSVKVVGNKIYTGCYMEFGFWLKNNFGILEYTSLSKNKQFSLIEDEQFWQIINLDNWLLFSSLNRIYIYNTIDESFRIIESESTITKLFKVDNAIYFQDLDIGIYKIVNGKKSIFIDHNSVRENSIINIFSYQGKLLVQTENKGVFEFYKGTLSPWDKEINKTLSNYSLYSSIKLKDGGFAFGTISNGVIILDKNGELVHEINQNLGLSNNTVLSVFEDVDSNIWLGLDNGINCINSKSPIKIFYDSKGQLGSVYASAIYNGNLYLGTNQGLFYRDVNNATQSFRFIEGTQGQVWCLQIIDKQLFCGHNSGTYLIVGNQAKNISNAKGTWSIKTIKGKPNLLLQGNYNGLNILEKENGVWSFKNKIEGFDISSRFFELVDSTTIFVNHEYKGVYKIDVDDAFTNVKTIDIKSVSKGLHSSLFKYNNGVYYVFREGFYKYNFNEDKFLIDSLISRSFKPENYTSGKLIHDLESNTLWGFTKTDIIHVKPGKLSNKPEIKEIALPTSFRNSVISYENIIHVNGSKYLFGTNSGYLIFDINRFENTKETIALKTIASSKSNGKSKSLSILESADLEPYENNIEFTYCLTQFNKFKVTEYQHQLLGIYNEWSDWTTEPKVLYKNLPSGDYTFNVRARVGENVSKNTSTYQFYINKTWYASNVAVIIYVLSAILLILLLHYFFNNYHKRQREKILSKAQRDLEHKELENKQQQMQFKNQQLHQDIESKSRELAIATMSLIKKNEFLNSIKTELNSKGSDANIKSVIKIIDKNINTTDDWKFFQEAFNNADKDFLKKLKTVHSTLTPNDLKLCAYLRLNLSSKEIAPLLNISPRSVEVKRYRLRKKMNLPHETSLANYIIEL
ncbi:LuxR C-terminal-related transcriptional regulator [Lacinutrix sp. Bg11-31]|uniref:helix-turn-helix and ligand-binding sensor domain-containing protein n=1 Tax=Lacinutrix sp. Bg11-31 TaxID=2057808 RepID=UPI000C3130F3|nr:LuxR C-terminal-related transcriptional regulator [Lacinutrix sp. Bg11-31]AUC81772.1 LuxR family transcriptional regulator [Lacinutrix sp. Bg11-31]